MPAPYSMPLIAVVAVVTAGALGGLAIRFYPDKGPSKENPLTFTEQPLPTPSQEPTSAVAGSTSTVAPLPSSSLSGASSQPIPSPEPSRVPLSSPATPDRTPVPPSSQAAPNIFFRDLPTSVRSGQSFTVTWQVTGPPGVSGSNTTLKVERRGGQQSGSSTSTSNSTSSQSFGSFTPPATFDADFTFAGDPGDIEVEVTATVGGQTISKQATIAFQE